MPNRKKTKRVNINLTYEDKKELEKLRIEKKLSYSTIANIITKWLIGWIHPEGYIYKDLNEKKTSIKPRNSYKSQDITNCLKLFLRKDLKKYILENLEGNEKTKLKLYNSLNNKIYDEMKDTYDPNWDGNEWHRKVPKILKQNPDYYKKLLGIEE